MADLLTGVYLFVVAVKDAQFRSEYHEYAYYWMTSWHCTITGVLSMTSSEVNIKWKKVKLGMMNYIKRKTLIIIIILNLVITFYHCMLVFTIFVLRIPRCLSWSWPSWAWSGGCASRGHWEPQSSPSEQQKSCFWPFGLWAFCLRSCPVSSSLLKLFFQWF